MKKILFFFFAVIAFYFGAIYQYSVLMALAAAQVLLLLFLTVQVRICGKKLKIAFTQKTVTTVKGNALSCEIAMEHQGKLPAGCVGFYMMQGYGCRQERMRLYGNDNSKSMRYVITPEYCGVKDIALKSVRIYDYLMLGSVKKTVSDKMRIMVFPKEYALDIHISDGETERYLQENHREELKRNPGSEIRQIREYREGDSSRQVHWKLSARMDAVLVKEYERETEDATELLLDLRGRDTASLQEQDRFYTLLWALLSGLLRTQDHILVYWQMNDDKGGNRMEISEPAQCRELLLGLYCPDEISGEKRNLYPERREASLVLDMNLCLFQGTELLCKFSGDDLEEEIRAKQIIIAGGA